MSRLLVTSLATLGLGLGVAAAAAPTAAPPPDPVQGGAAAVPEGRSLFNQYCSHCHSPNAINPDPQRDLRRLRRRYGERTAQVFYATVVGGRPDRGMPTWGGTLDEPTIWKIFAFLESVQSPPD